MDLSNKVSLYKIYRRKKPNGSFRVIYAPCPELKIEQSKLKTKLESRELFELCFGGIKNRSVVDAAKHHIKKDWIISLDIKDFFPSVNKDMVLSLGLNDYEAELATYKGKLVQGSPCSPIIANLILEPIMKELCVIFGATKITVTSYCDDITLSGYGKPKWEYVKMVEEKLNKNGFLLNRRKSKFMFKNEHQKVLGVSVNTGISLNKKQRKSLQNEIKYGIVTDKVIGRLAYLNAINKQQYNKLIIKTGLA